MLPLFVLPLELSPTYLHNSVQVCAFLHASTAHKRLSKPMNFEITSSGDCQNSQFWSSNFGTHLGGSLAPKRVSKLMAISMASSGDFQNSQFLVHQHFWYPFGVSECQNFSSEKLQNESSPNFLNFRPEFCSEFSANFSRIFSASFPRKRRSQKFTKNPRHFQCQIPRQLPRKIHKSRAGCKILMEGIPLIFGHETLFELGTSKVPTPLISKAYRPCNLICEVSRTIHEA